MAATMTMSFPAHWPEWARQFPAELMLPEDFKPRPPVLSTKLKAASPFEYDIVWQFQEEQMPCTCCAPTLAIEFGVWTCQTTHREWAVISPDDPHWASINEQELAAKRAAETPAQRAAREAAEAKEERDRELDGEASKMSSYAQDVGIRSTRKVQGKLVHNKVEKPCKWLYLNEAAPRSQWRKNEKGEWCAPMVRQLTGSQCWAWEYVHPKSKQHMKPHKCDHLHPGEVGWRKEWDKDRTFNPQGKFETLGSFRGVAAPALAPAAAAPKPKPKPKPTNPWEALNDNSGW